MKTKNLLFALCVYSGCLCCNGLTAQTVQLYGLTPAGGANNAGAIVKMNPDGTGFTKVYDFIDATGSTPVGGLLQGKDGKLYGNCNLGGYENSCVLFSFDPSTGTYDTLFNYFEYTGDDPNSGLIQLPDGRLCGVSSSGGVYGAGVIYSFDPVNLVYSDLYDFNFYDSLYIVENTPYGKPLLATDGKLYGITTNSYYYPYMDSSYYESFGNLYSFDINTHVYTDLHDFKGTHEGYGWGSLIQLNDGLIYGMTSGNPEGINPSGYYYYYYSTQGHFGNIFSFDPTTNTYTDLHDFDSINGTSPVGTLMYASDGKLYGTTSTGGAYNLGTLFSFDPVSKTFTHLFDFNNETTGVYPCGDLTQSTDGNLYGSTYGTSAYSSYEGYGIYGYGTFFQFNPNTKAFKLVATLDGTNGAYPMGGGFTVYQGTTGIPPIENTVNLNVYPIPANNFVTLHLELPFDGKAVINLYDEAGKNVWGLQRELPAGESNTNIDVSCLASGIYILNVSVNGNSATGKIVVQ